MAPWKRGARQDSWASNGNVSVYIFFTLFAAWLGFQVWARFGGGTPPVGLDPMVMAALGVAITSKSVEKRNQERTVDNRVTSLEDFAREAHPETADRVLSDDEKNPKQKPPKSKPIREIGNE